jgi:hypothetical protein
LFGFHNLLQADVSRKEIFKSSAIAASSFRLAFITFLRGDLTFQEDADFVLSFSFTYNSFRLPARLIKESPDLSPHLVRTSLVRCSELLKNLSVFCKSCKSVLPPLSAHRRLQAP